jgi:hypothetical protein
MRQAPCGVIGRAADDGRQASVPVVEQGRDLPSSPPSSGLGILSPRRLCRMSAGRALIEVPLPPPSTSWLLRAESQAAA